jgi:hypothetical protein
MEEGCFIALCRVLISKCRSVAGEVTDRDAKEAVQMGYDCVYVFCSMLIPSVLPSLIHSLPPSFPHSLPLPPFYLSLSLFSSFVT